MSGWIAVEHVEAELFNNAVVRLPPRRFLGVFIQGDSLSIHLSGARSAAAAGTVMGPRPADRGPAAENISPARALKLRDG
ncbi:DUF6959 family protein [Streptomyces globisporus]|uniref:DUF6959 family protein n=1 Tax=Streptomyces globisporus TaxID=1908 RepID=UPI0037A826AC